MSSPEFSIIVPVYNAQEYLDECVRSVLSQSCTDFELLLVDDGSVDDSPAMCDRFSSSDGRVKAIHTKNGGASKARNTGLDYASGEYIIFLDSDDYWDNKDALHILSKNISENHSDILMFGCTDWNTVTGEKKITRCDYDLDLLAQNDIEKSLHYLFSNKLLPGGPTVFAVKSSLINKINLRFKEGIQAEDYDWVLSLFCNCSSISAVNEPFYIYRKGQGSTVSSGASIKLINGTVYTIEKWENLADTYSDVIRADILNYLAFIYSTGIIIIGRMSKADKNSAIEKMKPFKHILSCGYWKKVRLVKYFLKLFGFRITAGAVHLARNALN